MILGYYGRSELRHAHLCRNGDWWVIERLHGDEIENRRGSRPEFDRRSSTELDAKKGVSIPGIHALECGWSKRGSGTSGGGERDMKPLGAGSQCERPRE